MKGIAPIVIALGVVIAVMVAGAIFFNSFIEQRITGEVIAKENEYLEAVDKMEMVKRGLPFALYYSFKEALRRGGYTSISEVQDMKEFEENVTSIFVEYSLASKEEMGVEIPAGDITISISGDEAELSFSSSKLLKYTSEWFEIFENPNTTIRVKGSELLE